MIKTIQYTPFASENWIKFLKSLKKYYHQMFNTVIVINNCEKYSHSCSKQSSGCICTVILFLYTSVEDHVGVDSSFFFSISICPFSPTFLWLLDFGTKTGKYSLTRCPHTCTGMRHHSTFWVLCIEYNTAACMYAVSGYNSEEWLD